MLVRVNPNHISQCIRNVTRSVTELRFVDTVSSLQDIVKATSKDGSILTGVLSLVTVFLSLVESSLALLLVDLVVGLVSLISSLVGGSVSDV